MQKEGNMGNDAKSYIPKAISAALDLTGNNASMGKAFNVLASCDRLDAKGLCQRLQAKIDQRSSTEVPPETRDLPFEKVTKPGARAKFARR